MKIVIFVSLFLISKIALSKEKKTTELNKREPSAVKSVTGAVLSGSDCERMGGSLGAGLLSCVFTLQMDAQKTCYYISVAGQLSSPVCVDKGTLVLSGSASNNH